MIDQSELDHIKALRAKATKGILVAEGRPPNVQLVFVGEVPGSRPAIMMLDGDQIANAQYAAESWNLMTRLIEELEAARKALQPQAIPAEGPIKKIDGPVDYYYQLDGAMLLCFARSNMEPVAFYDLSALPKPTP